MVNLFQKYITRSQKKSGYDKKKMSTPSVARDQKYDSCITETKLQRYFIYVSDAQNVKLYL